MVINTVEKLTYCMKEVEGKNRNRMQACKFAEKGRSFHGKEKKGKRQKSSEVNIEK